MFPMLASLRSAYASLLITQLLSKPLDIHLLSPVARRTQYFKLNPVPKYP